MLLAVLQGSVGPVGAAAQRCGAQGVGGRGPLHALHVEKKTRTHEGVTVTNWETLCVF